MMRLMRRLRQRQALHHCRHAGIMADAIEPGLADDRCQIGITGVECTLQAANCALGVSDGRVHLREADGGDTFRLFDRLSTAVSPPLGRRTCRRSPRRWPSRTGAALRGSLLLGSPRPASVCPRTPSPVPSGHSRMSDPFRAHARTRPAPLRAGRLGAGRSPGRPSGQSGDSGSSAVANRACAIAASSSPTMLR